MHDLREYAHARGCKGASRSQGIRAIAQIGVPGDYLVERAFVESLDLAAPRGGRRRPARRPVASSQHQAAHPPVALGEARRPHIRTPDVHSPFEAQLRGTGLGH